MVRHGRQHHRAGADPLILLAFGALLIAGAPDADGQIIVRRQPVGSLAGTVVDESGSPVSYAMLRMPALDLERFTDASGRFDFGGIPAGAYQVLVSQTGYSPRDTIMWVDTARAVGPSIRLRRAAPALSELTPQQPPRCNAPQEVESTAPLAFAEIFDQLVRNATRFRVLSQSYPFVATYERVHTENTVGGAVDVVDTDTSVIRSVEVPKYAEGQVVRLIPRVSGDHDYNIRIPTLADIGGADFRRSHCFTYGGVEEFAGERVVRVDFRVADWVATPDVDGAVYLDSLTMQVRGVHVSLTRMPQRGVDSLTVTTLFRELGPNLVIPTQVSATTWLRTPRVIPNPAAVATRVENQWLINVGFFGTAPGSLIANAP